MAARPGGEVVGWIAAYGARCIQRLIVAYDDAERAVTAGVAGSKGFHATRCIEDLGTYGRRRVRRLPPADQQIRRKGAPILQPETFSGTPGAAPTFRRPGRCLLCCFFKGFAYIHLGELHDAIVEDTHATPVLRSPVLQHGTAVAAPGRSVRRAVARSCLTPVARRRLGRFAPRHARQAFPTAASRWYRSKK